MSDLTKKSRPSARDELAASIARVNAYMERKGQEAGSRPHGFKKPPFGTSEYRHAHAVGWVSNEEALADRKAYLERSERAKASYGCLGKPNPRESRPAPRKTLQYAGAMSMTANIDDRLTPQAKATLGIIRAFCGKGRFVDTTKSFLATRMSRHARSILRYLTQLKDAGYIVIETRRNRIGMDIGIRIWITDAVFPFFAKDGPLAEWLARTGHSSSKQGKTNMSSNNDSSKILFLFPEFHRQKQPRYSP